MNYYQGDRKGSPYHTRLLAIHSCNVLGRSLALALVQCIHCLIRQQQLLHVIQLIQLIQAYKHHKCHKCHNQKYQTRMSVWEKHMDGSFLLTALPGIGDAFQEDIVR